MIDLGTGNNNKINWAIEDKQEVIDIVETVYRGATAASPQADLPLVAFLGGRGWPPSRARTRGPDPFGSRHPAAPARVASGTLIVHVCMAARRARGVGWWYLRRTTPPSIGTETAAEVPAAQECRNRTRPWAEPLLSHRWFTPPSSGVW